MRNAAEPIVTAKGTVIDRNGSTQVGKLVGNHLYLHRDYAAKAIAILSREDLELGEKFAASQKWKEREFPQFGFRCVRLDLSSGTIRFDQAPDFGTAREPMVGDWLTVNPDGSWTKGYSKSIWHHRWLWVKDDHVGFSAALSRAWSAKYVPLLKEPPKGSQRAWLAQLMEVGLI